MSEDRLVRLNAIGDDDADGFGAKRFDHLTIFSLAGIRLATRTIAGAASSAGIARRRERRDSMLGD